MKTQVEKAADSTRTVQKADALTWLAEQQPLAGCSIITSMPDISEFPKMSLEEWQKWFTDAAALVLSRCPDDGITIFYQTDIKRNGVWIDKGFLCQTAAQQVGSQLIAHKIVCRASAGVVSFGRPAYTHLLCFSKKIRPAIAQSFADVLPEAGETTWTRGMGVKACQLACKMVLAYTQTRTIVDPFCGHGTVLAVANALGMNAIGIDLSSKCVKKSRELTLSSLKPKVSQSLNS